MSGEEWLTLGVTVAVMGGAGVVCLFRAGHPGWAVAAGLTFLLAAGLSVAARRR